MRSLKAVIGMIGLVGLASCGGYSASGPYGGGGGSNGGGGPVGSVNVGSNGNIVFSSAHNGTTNPAVDTVAAGSTVTWTWSNNRGIAHSVQSLGATAFTSSAVMSGNGQTHSVTFPTPGTYQYDCAVHGLQMTGTIVVR
jgi:plastocyanin